LYHITYKKAVCLIPFHPLFSKNLHRAWILLFHSPHTIIIHSIHSSNSSKHCHHRTHKKNVIQKCTLDCTAEYESISVTKPSLWWYFPQITFSHTAYFDWKCHPNLHPPPTSKLLPDSHTKIFLSPPFSFCSDCRCCCCCCCHHLHIILPRKHFQPAIQPANQPSYLQMLFVLYGYIIRIIARCRLFLLFFLLLLPMR
jgi:hypothetical protein